MSNEIWKPIPGLEQYYQVSNLGRVKSLARETVAKWKSIPEYKFFFKERILKPSKDKCRISSCKNRQTCTQSKFMESTSTCMVSFPS
jgi:hypothetical protein|nr:MAG TPA: NUMOD4 motif protein [Caudoviricetes sp.]